MILTDNFSMKIVWLVIGVPVLIMTLAIVLSILFGYKDIRDMADCSRLCMLQI